MTTLQDLNGSDAEAIIEELRKGIPPKRFVSLYSAGGEVFLESVRKRHLQPAATRGKIRFISGSYGAGKTHFMRLLREKAFEEQHLVSMVELKAEETPFNKFEQVFFEIVRSIASPEMYREGDLDKAPSFREVLRRCLFKSPEGPQDAISVESYQAAREGLFAAQDIDIDFRRMVSHFWETYLPEGGDPATLEDIRSQIMEWFAGVGTLGSYRSRFGVQKIVTRANARLMLESLSRFAVHSGYRGLLILLDETQYSYSTMRKASLKQAHNNLLHLVNSIDGSNGAFLVYAVTPDFFIDERYGITVYGALAQRIGRPEDRAPNALEKVWNLDAIETLRDDYLEAACKIRAIYLLAYPDLEPEVPTDATLRSYVSDLVGMHPEYSMVSTWRVVVTGSVKLLDAAAGGTAAPPVDELHADIMEELRER